MSKDQTTTPFILFITGISTSGKTTLYESLKLDKTLADVQFHDIDEAGVPPVGRGPWRSFRVEELFFEAVERKKNNISTIICGITEPHEVVESRYYSPTVNVYFLLLDIPFEIFEQRIQERIRTQDKQGTFDKVFNPDAYQELIFANKRLKQKLTNSIINQKNGHLLETATYSKELMHEKTLEIIRQMSA